MAETWYLALWLSQWIGIYEGLVVLSGFKNRWSNGLYLYLGFIPCVAFFLNLFRSADILFYLNHAPHILIFGFFKRPQLVEKRSFWIGLLFILTFLNMTFYLGFQYDFQEAAVNTTTNLLFPIVLVIIIGWYFYLEWYFRTLKLE